MNSHDPGAVGRRPSPLEALGEVLQALDALRNAPTLVLLLATFAAAGLLLASAEASLAREAFQWGRIEAGAELTVMFYGSNAAGRAVAELGVAVVGVDVPAQQLMAGLFGYGLRSLGAVGAPVAASAHGAAALVGGGVVCMFALLLPGLVSLRGACAVYLALAEDAAEENR